MLALAYLIERKIDSGELADYADAARQIGVTRARVTQITNLLNLAPAVQERLLMGDLDLSERRLRLLTRVQLWGRQRPRDAPSPA